MLGAGDRFEQEIKDRSQIFRSENLFAQIIVGSEELECADACRLDFIQIFDNELGRGEFFGQSPFERIVPESGRDPAERLFDSRGGSKKKFSTRKGGHRVRDLSRLSIKIGDRDFRKKLAGTSVDVRESIVERF